MSSIPEALSCPLPSLPPAPRVSVSFSSFRTLYKEKLLHKELYIKKSCYVKNFTEIGYTLMHPLTQCCDVALWDVHHCEIHEVVAHSVSFLCGVPLYNNTIDFLSTVNGHLGYVYFLAIDQQSPPFLAPGISFMEYNFSTDQRRGRWFQGMIQVYYIYCVLHFYYYYIVIHNEIVIQLTIMQNQWEPSVCFPGTRWSHPGVVGDSDTQSVLLMFSLLHNHVLIAVTAENHDSQR